MLKNHNLSVIAACLVALASQPAMAQLDPSIVAQGQVLSGMQRGYAERVRAGQRGHVTPRQRALCANKARYRAQYGWRAPDIRKLYALCRNVGL